MNDFITNETELQEFCDTGTCDSCEGCVTGICQSCGMPMTTPQDFGGGDTESKYCVNCCHPDGSLKSYDEILKAVTALMMDKRNMDREAAAGAAVNYLSIMPAWSER